MVYICMHWVPHDSCYVGSAWTIFFVRESDFGPCKNKAEDMQYGIQAADLSLFVFTAARDGSILL